MCRVPVALPGAAGPAGHRLGHGEEGDGAQTRPHPAEGERAPHLLPQILASLRFSAARTAPTLLHTS